jgi:polar amino acid transport system substrate-binding protein
VLSERDLQGLFESSRRIIRTTNIGFDQRRLKMKRIMLLASSFILLTALLTIGCAPREPRSVFEKIVKEGKMVVGISADTPPFASVDDQGTFVGFEIDLIQEVGKRLGWETGETYLEIRGVQIEFVEMDPGDLATAVQEGGIDAGMAMLKPTSDLQGMVDFTIPYWQDAAIAVPKGDGEVKQLLDGLIQELLEEGYIQDLADTWNIE